MPSYDIIFKPKGIDKLVESQRQLVKQAGGYKSVLTKTYGEHQSSLGLLNKEKEAWEKIATSSDKTVDEIETANKVLAEFKSKAEEIEKPFESLFIKTVPFGKKIVEVNNKISEMVTNFRKVQQAGGFTKVAGDYMTNLTSKVSTLKGFMSETFGGGIQGMIGKIGAGLRGLIPIAGTLLASLGPIVIAIGAIIAIVFTLKRMWINNVGGMQTTFHRMVGTLKDAWAKFIVGFDTLLRKLGPLLKVVFGVIWIAFMITVKQISALFKAVYSILEPIFDVLGEIGKTIGEAFGMGKTEGKGFMDILSMMFKPLEWIGKLLGFILKVALFPITLSLKLMQKGIQLVRDNFDKIIAPVKMLWNWFMKLSFVQKIFKGIQEAISKTKDFLMAMIEPFKWIIEGAQKIAKWLGFGSDEADKQAESTKKLKQIQERPISTSQVTNNKNNTVNNNSNVVVNSSGPITEDSAPQIGNVISASIVTGSRVT